MSLFSTPLSTPSPPLPKPYRSQHQTQSTAELPPRVKVPTAPWMTTPLLLPADQLAEPPKTRPTDPSMHRASTRPTRSLTSRIPGGRTRKSVLGIIKSVKSLQKLDPTNQFESKVEEIEEIGEWGEKVERPNLPWIGGKSERDGEIVVFRREKKKREVTEAERRIAPEELQRLRMEGKRLKR